MDEEIEKYLSVLKGSKHKVHVSPYNVCEIFNIPVNQCYEIMKKIPFLRERSGLHNFNTFEVIN